MGWPILGVFAGASIALNLWQWLSAQRFPLHRPALSAREKLPPVTLLKPLKGCDNETRACLKSWLLQKYPAQVRVLFGVASREDPVCRIVRELIREHPAARAELIFTEPVLGPNGKVSSLTHLERVARDEFLVISDADVVVEEDFLIRLMGEMLERDLQLINCFYALKPVNTAMKLEALAVNADFWSQVLQGLTIRKMDFALGAVIATRASELRKIGGVSSLVEYLADDYELGNRIAEAGGKLGLCSAVVECRSHAMTWKEVWNHQLRWSRTIRVCQPFPYFLSVVSNPTFWPFLWAVVDRSFLAAAVAAIALVLRLVTAASNYGRLYKERKGNPFWMAPFKDLFQLAIWAFSFSGNTVSWRGERFRVCPAGKLKRIN